VSEVCKISTSSMQRAPHVDVAAASPRRRRTEAKLGTPCSLLLLSFAASDPHNLKVSRSSVHFAESDAGSDPDVTSLLLWLWFS